MDISRKARTGRLVRAGMAMVTAAAVASLVPSHGAGASSTALSKLHFKGAHASSANGGLLLDHGGPVLPASKTFVIWWGPSSAWASDVQGGIGSLFAGFSGSSYLGIAQQYMRGPAISSSPSGTKTDTSAPPSKVNQTTLGNEVVKMFGTPDPGGIYFVYTSNFPRGGNFCAWHSYSSVGSSAPYAVAYMPNTTNIAGCDPGNQYNVSGSEGLRSLANVSAHEFMEAVTDDLPANGSYAWIDSSGSEIGDKCAWQFSSSVTLANKSVWQLQEEWSNAANGGSGGCVQG